MGFGNKSFDFQRHLTFAELDYGFNWQLWRDPFYTRPLQGKVVSTQCLLKGTAFWIELWVENFRKFFALSEKLLWWVGNPDGRGSLQGMLIRRMKRKQIEKVEERKMGWWEETGEEKERGAGHHSNIDLLAPLFRYLRLSETVGKQEIPESAFS